MTSDEIVISLTETQARSKSNGHRIDKLEQSVDLLNKLAEAVALLAHEQQAQTATIKVIQQNVDRLQAKAAKRWDSMVEKVGFGVAASVLGALATMMLTRMLGG